MERDTGPTLPHETEVLIHDIDAQIHRNRIVVAMAELAIERSDRITARIETAIGISRAKAEEARITLVRAGLL
ncbi:MAG TPA: hypothetical protein VI336_01055 [Candidatus Saccharimonadales bacterium]|nr:hypothetical protein [Candidatus Saccharimonadales bacterium]